MVGDDASSFFPHGEDELAVKEGPSRVAVQHEDGGALPFVQIVDAVALGEFDKVAREGILLAKFVSQFQLARE
jgi:hypothetical protein